LLVLAVIVAFFAGAFVVLNADNVRSAVLPEPTPTPTKSPASYATSAKLYERDGEYKEAIGAYQAAIQLDPNNVDYLIDLIELLILTGDTEQALELADRTVELAGEDDRAQTVKAAAYIANADRLSNAGIDASEEYAKAAEAARNATGINPENGAAYGYLAAALVEQGDLYFGDAFDMAELAVAYEPDNPVVQYYFAQVMEYQGYYEASRRALETAIALDPNYIPPYVNLARINFFFSNERQSAILMLKDGIERAPDNADLYDTLSFLYLTAGQFPEAEENALKAVELAPDMVRALAHLGRAYFGQFNYEKAIPQLEAAIAGYGEPTNTTSVYFAMLGLAYYYENSADCSRAIPIFEAALAASDPNSPGEINALDGLELCRQTQISQ
jgi:tetratricopeptide (TPR) repeat protein